MSSRCGARVLNVALAVVLIVCAVVFVEPHTKIEKVIDDSTIEISVTESVYVEIDSVQVHSAASLDQCDPTGQCAESPAESMKAIEDGDTPKKRTEPSYLDQVHMYHATALNAAAKKLKELDDQVHVLIPQLQSAVTGAVDSLAASWGSFRSKCQAVYGECAVLYKLYLADIVAWLAQVYSEIAQVVAEVYAVVSEYGSIVIERGWEFWNTHEEVRIVARHFTAVLLLAAFGAVVFALYACVSTVPDSLVALLCSLDDVTRAQLKIIAMLMFAFAFYHLRTLWSLWGVVAVMGFFYYWSGHVVADVAAPLHRPRSRSGQAPLLRKSKTL